MLAKNLIAHCGSAEGVLNEKKRLLAKVPGIGKGIIKNFSSAEALKRAEKELRFIEDQAVRPLYFLDDDYPRRLRHCEDGPVMLYYRGNAGLNLRQVIAVVGTRRATDYGRGFCQNFIAELAPFNPLVVSGLAYGIDAASHKAALQYGLPTVAVLGHGLDRIYPSQHWSLAQKMEARGGLLTEFLSNTKPDRENFPKRNRIVAGVADAVVVVEAARSGGALITARLANSYNRDVFAVPGRLSDPFSEGCNFLIRTNQAALINSVEDLKYLLGWEAESSVKSPQQSLLLDELSDVEKFFVKTLKESEGRLELDQLCSLTSHSSSRALQVLMSLELKGVVRSLPGRVYSL